MRIDALSSLDSCASNDAIEQLLLMRRIYPMARARVFDLYDISSKSADFIVRHLRGLHTGILPAYLRWNVVGMVLVVWVVMKSGQ